MLTHLYTSIHIHTHPYAFRYIVVFLVHAFVQWHHMICFSILQNDCGPMDCISSCISCNELTRDKHVYWFKSAAHWIACLYNSLVNQKHIVGVYVSSREVAATDNSRKLRISDQTSESVTKNQRPRISDHIMRISDHISQISDHIGESATMNQRPRLNDYMLTLKFGRCFFF